MSSEDYKRLLVIERKSKELTDEEYENTLIHFAKLYHEEQKQK